jgi:putative transposase
MVMENHVRSMPPLESPLESPALGLRPAGIAEAFVKTFKRDYARLSILPDAETVIALLPAWFED